jgi:polyphosphate kinase
VTRNSELYIDEEEISNLLKAVENELHNRSKGEAVRLEVSADSPPEIRSELLSTLGLSEDDLYVVEGPVHPTRLMSLCDGDHTPELRDPPFVAPRSPALKDGEAIFTRIRESDVLLHHPYESFDTVVDFLAKAAEDPRVLAIKQTLYRTGGDRRIVGALMEAVKNGKQVTAVVELKARFDEANNIIWARRLEEAGVHVVYGVVGYKIHCKAALVVRRDEDAIRRYVHLGTGNYNPATARVYTDLSYFTCRPEFGEDAATLFNLLTGVCQYQEMRRLWVAPFEMKERLLELIRREARLAEEGLPARIAAKMNALVDEDVIRALYAAAKAGVEIDLVVRGICCLKPGVSADGRIRVRSIVSADWMPRNFHGRIEVAVPIIDGRLRERILTEVMGITLADTAKARALQHDGSYRLVKPTAKAPARRSQLEFIALAQNPVAAVGASKSHSKYPKLVLAAKPDPGA